jgi:hypothetical protein
MEYFFYYLHKTIIFLIVGFCCYQLGVLKGYHNKRQQRFSNKKNQSNFINKNYEISYLKTEAYSMTEVCEYEVNENVNYITK